MLFGFCVCCPSAPVPPNPGGDISVGGRIIATESPRWMASCRWASIIRVCSSGLSAGGRSVRTGLDGIPPSFPFAGPGLEPMPGCGGGV